MVLIIEACKVICLLHECLKSENPFIFNFFVFLTVPGHKAPITWQPFIAPSFSKLHHVSHVILHQVAYAQLLKWRTAILQKVEVFRKN